MAFHEAEQHPGYCGSLAIKEICARGQRHCDTEMRADQWAGRDHGHGWESNKSLLRCGLIIRDNQGRGYETNFTGPVDKVQLTAEGREFIPLMRRAA